MGGKASKPNTKENEGVLGGSETEAISTHYSTDYPMILYVFTA